MITGTQLPICVLILMQVPIIVACNIGPKNHQRTEMAAGESLDNVSQNSHISKYDILNGVVVGA